MARIVTGIGTKAAASVMTGPMPNRTIRLTFGWVARLVPMFVTG